MFFFIAGIQPKTKNLDHQPRRCPSCGLHQARMQRTDHYLSVFFVPLIPIKKGTPYLRCQTCGTVSPESGEIDGFHDAQKGRRCFHCGKPVENAFQFCPFCGKSL